MILPLLTNGVPFGGRCACKACRQTATHLMGGAHHTYMRTGVVKAHQRTVAYDAGGFRNKQAGHSAWALPTFGAQCPLLIGPQLGFCGRTLQRQQLSYGVQKRIGDLQPVFGTSSFFRCPAGRCLHAVLETSVSSLPKLEGKFLQVGGLTFGFHPEGEPGERVPVGHVTVGG